MPDRCQYIEFYLDGELHACRDSEIGTPRTGDEVMLLTGTYLVKECVWDYSSANASRRGLRIVLGDKTAEHQSS